MKYLILATLLAFNICNGFPKYLLYCDSKLIDASYDSMITQVGIIEKTNQNDGEVQKYLQLIGLKGNYPYCAAGQYWCFYVSAKALKIDINSIPIQRTGLAISMFNFAKNKGRKTAFSPQKHDLIVWRKLNSSKGHIERIISVQSKGWVKTVGFNTSFIVKNKKIEGVFMHKRNIFHILGLLQIRGLFGFEV